MLFNGQKQIGKLLMYHGSRWTTKRDWPKSLCNKSTQKTNMPLWFDIELRLLAVSCFEHPPHARVGFL